MRILTQLVADIRVRFNSLFRRGTLSHRVDEEVRFHIELRAARLIESGLSREQAWQRARLAFGNPTLIRDQTLEPGDRIGQHAVQPDAREQRTNEIGIRMAIGAVPQNIVRMLLIACVAAVGPARRAARIDPLRALRYE
jgi:hypothetical protein